MTDLSRKRERDRLPVRPDPYFQRLGEGQYLGFRRGPDTWSARYRGHDGKQQWQPLGEALEFDEAKHRAEDWFGRITGSAVRTIKRGTVCAALEDYLADLRRHGRPDAAEEAGWRFQTVLWADPLAHRELEAITKDDFLEWRDRLRPGREPRTVNRYVRAVVAGLNRAVMLGHVGTRGAWLLEPLADDIDDEGETAIFLSPGQRGAIVAKAEEHAAAFLRGLELTGARPKELAATKVSDFDGKALRLAHRKGRPPKLRVRYTVLGPEGVAFFRQQAQGKLPTAPLFTEDGEQMWRRHIWAREVRAAISKVNEIARGADRIPDGASAYSYRHARISELLQVYGIDPLTVAHQTGTSIAMIEKAYMRFIPAALQQKLAAIQEP